MRKRLPEEASSPINTDLQNKLLELVELPADATSAIHERLEDLGNELSSNYGTFLIKDLASALRKLNTQEVVKWDLGNSDGEGLFWGKLIRDVISSDIAIRKEKGSSSFVGSLEIARSLSQQKVVLDAMLEFREWPAAKELARNILEKEPDCRLTQALFAKALRCLGEHQQSIDIWKRLVSQNPNHYEFHNELGNTYQAERQFDAAFSAYKSAVKLNPRELAAHLSLFHAAAEKGDQQAAEEAFQSALTIENISSDKYEASVRDLIAKGFSSKTKLLIKRWLEEFPENPIALHLFKACSGENELSGALEEVSHDYIKTEFDKFANSFEVQLRLLGYLGPEALDELLNERFQELQFAKVLDGGCGTGWCGPVLRKFAGKLEGVDLSRSMLNKADQKQVFDELIEADLLRHLNDSEDQYDLIVCLDSLIYFGNLTDIVEGLSHALKPEGFLIFNLELLETSNDGPRQLQLNGRYSHTIESIEVALAENGFQAEVFERRVLRLEGGEPVYHVLVLAKPKLNDPSAEHSPKYRDRSTSDRIEIFNSLVRMEPNSASAHFQLGNAYLASKKIEDALKNFEIASRLGADEATFCNLGNAYAQLGDLNNAYRYFLRSLDCRSDFVPALNNAGRAAFELGNQEDALQFLRKAEQVEPENAKTQAFLGNLYFGTLDYEKAERSYQTSVKLDPGQPDIFMLLGHAQLQQNNLGAAAVSYVQAQQLSPQNPMIYDSLGRVNHLRGQTSEASFCFLQALRLSGGAPQIHSHLIHNMIFDATVSHNDYISECGKWSAILRERVQAKSTTTAFAKSNSDKTKTLRVGYIHPEILSNHTGNIIGEIVRNHDYSKLNVYLYCRKKIQDQLHQAEAESKYTLRQVNFDRPEQVAETIRSDGIDVLIDLAGHLPQASPAIFYFQPAPVMIAWPVEVEPCLLPEIEWIICDQKVLNNGYLSQFSNRQLRIEGTFCPLIVPANLPVVAPREKGSVVRFCCCSEMARISSAAIEAWSQILLRTNNTELCIANRELQDESICRRLQETFQRFGIASERIVLKGVESIDEKLQVWSMSDIGLDSVPANSLNDSFQALLMGCPVITVCGASIQERVTSSLLDGLRHGEWIANGLEDYVEKAIELADNRSQRSEFRQELRTKAIGLENCDPQKFTLKLEEQLNIVWQNYLGSDG